MACPVIVVVGRPNVGKSTFFNRLVGRRDAIVEDYPGVTRDRHYGEGEVLGHRFIAIDTGGFEPASQEGMLPAMREQAEIAMEEADAIIALYDGRAGLTPGDQELAQILMRTHKPVFHTVNKIDGPRHEPLVAEFWEMGVHDLFSISAEHGSGFLDLMEVVVEALPSDDGQDMGSEVGVTRVAVIGKPNAGKSTLVNRLLGEERLLVSDVPGTTRDAIDTRLDRPAEPEVIQEAEAALAALEEQLAGGLPEPAQLEVDDDIPVEDWDDDLVSEGEEEDEETPAPWLVPVNLNLDMEDREWSAPEDDAGDAALLQEAREAVEAARTPRRYLFIDTAGIRRRKWIRTKLERVSIIQSFKAIDRAEVCVLLIDATAGVTEQDAKLAGMIRDKGRACVLLVNKWDAIADKDNFTAGNFVKELRDDLKFLRHAPILFISGLTGQRVHRIFREVERVKMNTRRRVSTGALNRFLASAVRRQQPPLHRNRRFRMYYASQVAVSPPTFLLSVNDPTALHFSYRRFLINQIRAAWDFEGTPIRLVLRKRQSKR